MSPHSSLLLVVAAISVVIRLFHFNPCRQNIDGAVPRSHEALFPVFSPELKPGRLAAIWQTMPLPRRPYLLQLHLRHRPSRGCPISPAPLFPVLQPIAFHSLPICRSSNHHLFWPSPTASL